MSFNGEGLLQPNLVKSGDIYIILNKIYKFVKIYMFLLNYELFFLNSKLYVF